MPESTKILTPGLYVVATPIGNLEDITLRALRILKNVTLIACENPHMTQKLLLKYNIKNKLIKYSDHHALKAEKIILDQARYDPVALVSDAGTPLISDPGYPLIQACRIQNIAVTVIPGPSALTTALALAGLPTEKFSFHGFLPTGSTQRRHDLTAMASSPVTQVWFEAPHRLQASLADAYDILGPRQASVLRELTKMFETCHTGTLKTLAQAPPPSRGEIVVVVAGAIASPIIWESLEETVLAAWREHPERSFTDMHQWLMNLPAVRSASSRQAYAWLLTLKAKTYGT